MPSQEDIEQRLKAVLTHPYNRSCSECDRPENKPVWAAFLSCPVDQKMLGVVCCKKCYKLFNKVEGADFTVKSLKDLKDWKEDNIEALELAGNRLVNTCYEATVTNEKDGRDKRKYGYEAFFFEKYVNLTHFDEVLYKQMINQASKALVEKRFNKSLRGYNLKKTAAEDEDEDHDHSNSNSESDHSHHEDSSSHGTDPAAPAAAPSSRRRSGGVQRANSARGLRSRQGISNRRRQSARNLMVSEDKEDGNSRPSLSRHRLNSLRRELMDEKDGKGGGGDSNHGANPAAESNGRMRRRISARSLMVSSDDNHGGHEPGTMRRTSSRNRLNVDGGNEPGTMRRTSSRSRLNADERGDIRRQESKEDRRGMRRASSNPRLAATGGDGDGGLRRQGSGEERERERRTNRDMRSGRHRLLA